jgi:hypothetical protein
LLDFRGSIVPQFTPGILSELTRLTQLTLPINFNYALRILPSELYKVYVPNRNIGTILQFHTINHIRIPADAGNVYIEFWAPNHFLTTQIHF